MKLTKRKLLEIVRGRIVRLGYLEFNDNLTGANGLFVKLVNNEYFLSLGLILSNYYDTKFTASFYLSKTTRWGSIWGDIPRESYQRIGHFLTQDERQVLLDEEFKKEGIKDAWWDVDNNPGIDGFFNVIEVCEERFLNQEDLFSKIENSIEVNELARFSSDLIAILDHRKLNGQRAYRFTPDKSLDDVPLAWFQAAEVVLDDKNGVLNASTVKLLAVDAWRQYQVKTILGSARKN